MLGRTESVVRSPAGREIGYMLRGPADAPTAVYLHGMPGCRSEQLVFGDALLERLPVRLLSIDRPGWGNTDALAGDRIARVADVTVVCDALGIDTFPLLALSAGGSYALTLAATVPERVEQVVLASAQMPYDDEQAIQGLLPDQLALLPLLRGRTAALIKGVEQWRLSLLADPLATLAPALATLTRREQLLLDSPAFSDLLVDSIHEGLRRGAHGALDDLLSWPRPFEVELADVRCPVTAFHGTADTWEPISNLRRVLDRLPDAQLISAEGLNHFATELYAELILALLR